MAQATTTLPLWCRALTLGERAAALSQEIVRTLGENEPGRQRLRRWQLEPQFAAESVLQQRLGSHGIDEEVFLYLLSEPPESLSQRIPATPSWLAGLLEAYAAPVPAYTDPAPGEGELGFLELVQPLVDQACERLYWGIRDLLDRWSFLPFDPRSIEDILLTNLPDPLLMRLGRTMVLELNVARLQGMLGGATPEERFLNFVERLRSPDVSMAILQEYPVLARQLMTCVSQWLTVSLEFLDRLCRDWQEIRRLYSPEIDPGYLVELIGGAGDTHRGGRSVMIARFESGFRIVYKPKSMAVDRHFQDLLAWLNERGCTPLLRTLTILDCATHGWMQYVGHRKCDSLKEVELYYRRLGLYLGLLYAINASDFHLENLIASGEHPYLIDLETLFNPTLVRIGKRDASFEAQREMVQSVLVVGMLPQRMWSSDEYGGLDISGLGGEAGQLTPDRLLRPDGLGTDEMRYVREQLALPGEANRPVLDGVEVSAIDHADEVVSGFRSMYRLLQNHRSELLAAGGPLGQFEQDEVRVLLRPTRTYDQLLFESFHPDVLRDALERDLLFDRLWLVVPERPFMAPVVVAEQRQLQQGDIPVFTSLPASLELTSGCGKTISGVIAETGMALARRRIEQLSDDDLHRQEWFIRASLATLRPYEFGVGEPLQAPYQLVATATNIDSRQMLSAARFLADRLVATAVRGVSDVCWIGLDKLAGTTWDISPVGMGLYNGLPGITLFLAYIGDILQNESYTALARRGVAGILHHIELVGDELPGIGGFEGWGGILYSLTNLGVIWDDNTVHSRAADVVDILDRLVEQDTSYGIQWGAAGAIRALLAYYHCQPSARVIEVATACGDHLLASAQVLERGIGWQPADSRVPPLAGFAHGAAGIALALLALAKVTGQQRFHVAGCQAIAYERSLFVPEVGNWVDLRPRNERADLHVSDTMPYPVAWCHGAVGIGLSRLAAIDILNDAEMQDEILTALNTTLAYGFGQGHCLCHGDMGNLELLLEAHRVLAEKSWRLEAQRLAGSILDSVNRHGWYCGGPGGIELPGLMLGVAGIGYQLLRLVHPERVPSVLTLAASS